MKAATSRTAHPFRTFPGPAGAVAAVLVAAALWGAPESAEAQDGITEVEVGCNDLALRCREVLAGISFPDQGIEGTLQLSFADATLLRAGSFELDAEIVDPRDPALAARLPRGTFIPDDFPVLITIEPVRDGQLSFRRNWTLELVTENLEFSSHTPFRLFRAPAGGRFEDISFSLGSGSYRVRGAGASFSEFVIAADLRPIERVVAGKFARLRASLNAFADELSAVGDDLDQVLDQAQQALEAENIPLAVRTLDTFVQFVASRAGTDIPDESDAETEGAAARLLANALTLRHALFLGLESAQGGMSGFSTRVQAGDFSAQLSLEFEEAFVVDPEDLDIEAETVNPSDAALLARLPPGVQVPEGFPVLIRINPKAGTDQAFGGILEIELQTDDLRFVGGTPLRLFKAPDGGAFEDVTRTYGLGSYRVRGAGASFSEFLVVEDLRPLGEVIAGKFEDLDRLFQANAAAIPPALRQQLQQAAAQVQQAAGEGRFGDAIEAAGALVATIEENSGEGIPALWRSGEAVDNVAGELIALLETLVFSLELSDAPTAAEPGDVNLDGRVDVGDIFFLIDQVFGDSPPPAEFFLPPSADEKR